MLCFLVFLLLLLGGIGVLMWFGVQRVATHLKNHPEGARLLAEHVVAPLLLGENEAAAEEKPVVKKTKGHLV